MKKKRFNKYIYVYLCVLGALVTAVFLCFSVRSGVRENKEKAYHMLELYGVRTEALLNGLFHKTDILESVVITNNGEIDKDTFDNLADALMDGKGTRAIQCLPDGVVEYCYPLEGNEGSIGDDVFAIPERREDAILAVDTKQIALSGPYDLTQGGVGLVARNPIFLRDESGGEVFWGFAVVVLDLPEALEPLMLSEIMKAGYDYQVSCEVNEDKVIVDQSYDGGTNSGKRIQELFEGQPGDDYVAVDIHVPNHEWNFKVTASDGWINKRLLLAEGFICIVFTCLLTLVVYLLEQRSIQFEQYATTDELTGLFNRRRLKEYMDIRCRDKKVGFAVFYIDLNRFKHINDTIGHAGGDAVLIESGRRIKEALGKEGSVYRVGGDEFVAVMELDVSRDNCIRMAEHIKEELRKPFRYDRHDIEIGASTGYVIFPEEADNLDDLIKLGDKRMYQEKK